MKVYDYGKTKNCLICGNIDGNFDRFIKIVVGSLRNLKSYVVETHPKEIERQERLARKREEESHNGGGRIFGGPAPHYAPRPTRFKKTPKMMNCGYNLTDTVIIVDGCNGFGERDLKYYHDKLEMFNKVLADNNTHVLFVRGNDDPKYFEDALIDLSNIKTIQDYSVIKLSKFNCLCIGGFVSLDRTWRMEQEKRIGRKMYWENERMQYNEEDIDKFLSSIDKNRRYIVEQFIDGSIVSFDGIANSKSEVVFSTQNIFLINNDEIVLNNLDDMYFCDPYLDPKFLELGKAVVKAVGLKKRFFHIEFFELKKDYPGIGNKGDRIPLEVNARPAGGYTPDIINFANSCSCYDIYADVMMYDENKEQDYPEKFYCASCSRRNTSSYLYSKEEVIAKYHNNICMAGEFPKVLRDDMGDSYFVAKFKTKEEMMEFDTFVRSKK